MSVCVSSGMWGMRGGGGMKDYNTTNEDDIISDLFTKQ